MDASGPGADLEAELAEARRQLAEAEATLEAIRTGNVDALVITDNRGQEEVRNILNMGSLANSMFNLVTQPIFILDGENKIQRINQAGFELAGPDPIGKDFLEALPLRTESPEGEGQMNPLARWIPTRRHIEGLDVNLDHPVLGTRFYLLDANPVEIGWDGEAGGIVTLMDITARKLAEIQLIVRSSQLRRQLSLLQSITESIPEGLLLLDDENRAIFCNRAALAILEREEHEVIGMELDSLFRPKPDPRDAADADGSGAAPGTGAGTQEGQRRGLLRRRAGEWLPVQYALHPIKDKQEEAGSILVMSDISERVAAEQALRQSIEKQQHSQRIEAIGRLAGGIAHDFNNLLLAILGFTDLSLVQVREGTQVHENLQEVKRAGERAAALTSQLLAYSRKQILDPKILDLNEAVRDVLKMLGRLVGENIRLEVGVAESRLPARFDQSKLQQVMVNMALNARDAMGEGGTLTLRTGLARIAERDRTGMVRETARENGDGVPPGEFAYVEIEDTGHGMPDAVLEHLFEPFFTTKEFGKGSGLGLSTAYGIVKQMGGHVQVYSATGKGSRFRVLFPLAQETEAVREAPRKEAPPAFARKDERILLVEDEPVVRKLLAKVLTDQGYQVIEAADGEEALERLPGPGEKPLSLVITDIVMDRMGGIELAGRLAALRPGLAVLFISGYAEDQHKLAVEGAERPFFAAKPFRPIDFLNRVRDILERKTPVAGTAAVS